MTDDEQEFEDNLAALRAQMDQGLMLAPELARATRAWYDAFLAQSFGDSQALYLAAVQLVQHPGRCP